MAPAFHGRWHRVLAIAGLLAATSLAAKAPAGSGPADREAPARWGLWRGGPLPFPQTMAPLVPEAVPGAIIPFAQHGADTVVVAPGDSGAELDAMVRMIRDKLPRATVLAPAEALAAARDAQYIVLGTLADNPFARAVRG